MIKAKIIFIILGLILFYFIFRIKYSYQFRIIEKLILFIIFIFGFAIIIEPLILDKIALFLKIERGRDFLFYIYILASFWGLLRSHVRINYQSSLIKKLASELALIKKKRQWFLKITINDKSIHVIRVNLYILNYLSI